MRHANVAFFIPHIGCPHQCSFCNQLSIAGAQAPTGDEVRETLSRAAKELEGREGAAQIAFFGGSFTAVPLSYQMELLKAAYPFVKNGAFEGIRVSTRPDAIDDDVLERIKKFGVTAVELGAQSMDDRVLSLNGRGHTAEDVAHASQRIREAGLELGLQMMTGLLGDTPEGAWRTAERLCELQPETVRIYPTVVLESTELARRYRQGSYLPETLEESVALCAGLLDLFEGCGIRVIRLGLHSGGKVEDGYLAGAYHPAFRELCESRRYRGRMEALLSGRPQGKVEIRVPVRCVSRANGYQRENIEFFRARGYEIRVVGDDTLCEQQAEVRAE